MFEHRCKMPGASEWAVIWTANDIGALGPAVLRRMMMCLELRVPNLATRTVCCGDD